MREIAPGLWHWTARHEHIGADVSSYYLPIERVLIDPMVPAEGIDWCADGIVRARDGGLAFVPDRYMDDPAGTKRGLREAYARLLELDFEVLLLAHGNPVLDGAKDALQRFVASAG